MNQKSTSEVDILIRAEDVTKNYPDGDVPALRGVSLSIRRGEYVVIMGPSGSGKSTLLNLLGALDTPTTGEVYFEERPITSIHPLHKLRSDKIGFVFQSFHLIPTLTSVENVQIPMFVKGWSASHRTTRATELLTSVGMSHRLNHFPNKLSVGERQRVALARALANDPVALLGDEPTGNLDTKTGNDVLDLFDRLHKEQNKTLVIITHSPEVAARADRVVHIRDGMIERED